MTYKTESATDPHYVIRRENVMDDEENWAKLVGQEGLTRRVTLDEYVAERLTRLRAHPEYDRLLAEQRQPLQALAIDGDGWRVWISGAEPLMQKGGLALVRADRIVWARMDWLS